MTYTIPFKKTTTFSKPSFKNYNDFSTLRTKPPRILNHVPIFLQRQELPSPNLAFPYRTINAYKFSQICKRREDLALMFSLIDSDPAAYKEILFIDHILQTILTPLRYLYPFHCLYFTFISSSLYNYLLLFGYYLTLSSYQ
jgi:hypothetical protein